MLTGDSEFYALLLAIGHGATFGATPVTGQQPVLSVKDRAKSSESAIIIRTRKRAGEILRDYYFENVHATVK